MSNIVSKNQSPDSIDYSNQIGMPNRNLIDKFRVQLPLVIIATLVAQFLLEFVLFNANQLSNTSANSVAVTMIANVLSMLSYRRLRNFPGSRRLAFLFPSFCTFYGMALIFLLFSRIPYSIQQFALGIFIAVMMAWVLNLLNRRQNFSSLLIIPSKRTKELIQSLPSLRYQICKDPSELLGTQQIVVADLHQDLSSTWEHAIAQATLSGSSIFHVKQVKESLTGCVQIDHLSENSFGTLAPNSLYFSLKMIGDRIASLLLLIVLAPVILAAIAAIRLETPGPAIFRQRRIGYQGKPFTLYKLRTMEYLPSHDVDKESSITIANDPRVTKVGRFLRNTRIDELPQLFNVLRSEMSLIGPRPEAEKLSEWYDETIDFYAYRHVVRPGITGWAQVKQGHVASTDDVFLKLQYDFYYIKHFSFWIDALIVCKTIVTIFTFEGAR